MKIKINEEDFHKDSDKFRIELIFADLKVEEAKNGHHSGR